MNRREFLKRSALLSAGAVIIPTIVPSSVFGRNAPSNRIHIGAIGCGRISRTHDMPGVWKHDNVRIVAVSDLDSIRLREGKELVENHYTRKLGTPYGGVKMYGDYTDLLADPDVDAVLISTPDHWHAKQTIDAVWAGKDVYLQKPASLTIDEGRLMSNAVNATGRILQIGSQQRSMEQFRKACEFVRSGRIGELRSIEIRLPGDPVGGNPDTMPVPSNLDYDRWLGPTPDVPYTTDRVHPQGANGKGDYGRPGWLRCEQFGAGMITGWGAHHFDIAHWAMDKEYSGPVEITAGARFPAPGSGLWNVHGDFQSEMRYDNGVIVRGMVEGPGKPNGVLFTGSDGWIFVSRGAYRASASDPVGNAVQSGPLTASDPTILRELTDSDVHLYVSDDHHGNWLESVRTRKPNITPAEVAHRSCTACLLQHISMKLDGRTLRWDYRRERFIGDAEADGMLSRPYRVPYGIV